MKKLLISNPACFLLQEELDDLAIKFPNRFTVYYVLNQVMKLFLISFHQKLDNQFEKSIHFSYLFQNIYPTCMDSIFKCVLMLILNKYTVQPPEIWNGGVGFVSKEMIQEHCPAPAPDIKVIFALHVTPHFLFLNHP